MNYNIKIPKFDNLSIFERLSTTVLNNKNLKLDNNEGI